jgi:predicted metal-dependent HD superfamily phosphohydrolase
MDQEKTYEERWEDIWDRLNAVPRTGLLETVIARYGERHRFFHTMHHVDESLCAFDSLSALCARPHEVEFAIWFHDAIQLTGKSDNESRSADLAKLSLVKSGGAEDAGARIHAMILATRYCGPAYDVDTEVFLDSVFWILGAPADRYDEYEMQLRRENRRISAKNYIRGRLRKLRELKARTQIFRTRLFLDTLEARAQENISRTIERLERGEIQDPVVATRS